MGKSADRTESRWNRRARAVLIWIGIPLLIIGALEVAARRLEAVSKTRLQWYPGAIDLTETRGVDFLFVGTSRTASGFVPAAWEDELERASGCDEVCLNLGRAYSGPVANYFGLRELLQRHPDRMRECVVFIELSAGLPAFTSDWTEKWFFEGNQQLIVDFMRRGDLTRFLRVREHSLEDKAGIAARYAGRGSTLIAARRRLQQTAEWRGMSLVQSVFRAFGAKERGREEVDLPENRQLRRDAAGIRFQRDLVLERVQPEELAAQRPLTPWSTKVICQAAEELRSAGVRVVFFDMPVPDYVWQVNSTPIRRADREAFLQWTRDNGIEVIDRFFEVTDADFPDLSHLRASRIEEYTRALAQRFLEGPGGWGASPAAGSR